MSTSYATRTLTRTILSNPISKTTYQIQARSSALQLLPRSSPLTTHRQFSNSQTMSSSFSPSSTKEWLCHIPDHPNKLEQRKAVRPEHLEKLKPNIDNRRVVMGGAFLSKHPEPGEGPDMLGSVIIVQADTKEEAIEFLRGDTYTKSGVWDLDSITVYPFKSAFRTPVS